MNGYLHKSKFVQNEVTHKLLFFGNCQKSWQGLGVFGNGLGHTVRFNGRLREIYWESGAGNRIQESLIKRIILKNAYTREVSRYQPYNENAVENAGMTDPVQIGLFF
jgi:hypothetical protein